MNELDEIITNKEIAIETVKNNGYALEKVSDELKDDKDVVLCAVKNEGLSLRFASDRLKDDKNMVLEAVRNDGSALQYASDRLKNDKDVAITTIMYNENYIIYVNDNIRKVLKEKLDSDKLSTLLDLYSEVLDSKEERPLVGWATAYPTYRFFSGSPGGSISDVVRIPGYKKGGYTGNWSGNQGKLAELHQKELVLNANDTENFLTATNSLRELVSLDSSIEKSVANAISKMLIELSGHSTGNITTTTSNSAENVNNTFNITAEFPNANDVNDIREAILSLPNLASQYINQKRF